MQMDKNKMRKSSSKQDIYKNLILSPKFSLKRTPSGRGSPKFSTVKKIRQKIGMITRGDIKEEKKVEKEVKSPIPLKQPKLPSIKRLSMIPPKPELARETFLNMLTFKSEDVSEWTKYTSYTPFSVPKSDKFLQAVKSNEYEIVKNFLVINKKFIDIVDSFGASPLHWAVKKNDEQMVEILLDAEASLESRDMMMRTPLFLATRLENYKIARLLLAAGASPNVRSLDGSTPLSIAKGQMRSLILEFRFNF